MRVVGREQILAVGGGGNVLRGSVFEVSSNLPLAASNSFSPEEADTANQLGLPWAGKVKAWIMPVGSSGPPVCRLLDLRVPGPSVDRDQLQAVPLVDRLHERFGGKAVEHVQFLQVQGPVQGPAALAVPGDDVSLRVPADLLQQRVAVPQPAQGWSALVLELEQRDAVTRSRPDGAELAVRRETRGLDQPMIVGKPDPLP